GSTGDGYRFAEGFGLKVETPIPSLVPFVAKEEWVKELMGLSLRNVEVTIKDGKKKLFTEFGEMVFTHFGVSGPAVLSASGVCAKAIRKNPLTLTIDLKPALTEEQLDKRMVREWEENSKKQFKNALGSFLPATLVPVMVRLSGISPEKEVSGISKKERQNLIALMKGFSLTLTGVRDFAEAIVTQGGVSVKEIAPKTMECKKVPGLYFAGEVLDVDACTGGYNLQIAWSTGHAAGKAAAEETQRI
ncbi:MAG: aminoacetone oxidase family FAD-binding enzyme, partial [Lachnospiraceae bacterium]|nr:aminoacetone oxidase family FAD-binding enzyme [Lachnospiraceae bacterium]